MQGAGQAAGHEIKAAGLTPQQVASATFQRGRGCSNCNHTGYRGRKGIYEMLRMNKAIREMTFNREPSQAIRRQARLHRHAHFAGRWCRQSSCGNHHPGGSAQHLPPCGRLSLVGNGAGFLPECLDWPPSTNGRNGDHPYRGIGHRQQTVDTASFAADGASASCMRRPVLQPTLPSADSRKRRPRRRFTEEAIFAESVCLTAEGRDNGDDGAVPFHVFGGLRV